MAVTKLLLSLACAVAVTAQNVNRTTLPGQLGAYPITITSQELRTNRNDTLAPTIQHRRIMLSIFEPRLDLHNKPCPDPEYSAYMPPETLAITSQDLAASGVPNGTLQRIQVESCPAAASYGSHGSHGSPRLSPETSPLLIFSPGSGSIRFEYTSMLSAVSSSGYTIIAIDHTYDGSVVQFPDGTLAFNNYDNITNSDNPADGAAILAYLGNVVVPVRAGDVRSVIDAVSQGKIKALEAYAGHGKTEVGAWGHSLGGDTALRAAEEDKRVKGSINYDGLIDGVTDAAKIHTPAMLVASENSLFNAIPEFNSSWDKTWENIEAWKLEFYVEGTAHLAYSDYITIADTMGLRGVLPADVAEELGTISGKRALEIVWRYTTAFFDHALRGKKEKLLEAESKEFPEVDFVRKQELVNNR